MTRLLITLIMMVATAAQIGAIDFNDESLNYRVTYKWGLIQKNAGRANLTLRRSGNDYHAVLTARSDPWADHIYSVRDTLRSHMTGADMQPLIYDKATHEAGKYSHDVIRYTYEGDMVTAECTRYRLDKKGRETASEISLEAPAPAVDMLSIYYFVRRLDYPRMTKGQHSYATIFSGKRKEKLTVIYDGTETLKVDGTSYFCYRISFTFTADGRPSSDPMTAWISTDADRIPVRVTGQLPVGKIHVLFTGKK